MHACRSKLRSVAGRSTARRAPAHYFERESTPEHASRYRTPLRTRCTGAMFAATFAATCSVVALGRGTLLALPSTVPARHLSSRCQAAAAWPGESDGQGTYAPPPVRPTGRWQRIGACDVLLPEFGGECGAIVHFVGGALVGGAPQNTYGAFLETLADFGVCVVANPSG
eukprot:scaffold74275_cov60-Phaeocystis_antarctica.AAC.1